MRVPNVEPKSNFGMFQSEIRQSRIFKFETVEYSSFRRLISKQLPLELI